MSNEREKARHSIRHNFIKMNNVRKEATKSISACIKHGMKYYKKEINTDDLNLNIKRYIDEDNYHKFKKSEDRKRLCGLFVESLSRKTIPDAAWNHITTSKNRTFKKRNDAVKFWKNELNSKPLKYYPSGVRDPSDPPYDPEHPGLAYPLTKKEIGTLAMILKTL